MYRPDYYKSLEGYYSVVVRNLKLLNEVSSDFHKALRKFDSRFFNISIYNIISNGFILEGVRQQRAVALYEFLKKNFSNLKPYILSQPYIEMYMDNIYFAKSVGDFIRPEVNIFFWVKDRIFPNSPRLDKVFLGLEDLVLIAGAQVEEEEEDVQLRQVVNVTHTRYGSIVYRSTRQEKVFKTNKDYYLDMIFKFSDGYLHIRIEMLDFNFASLGLPLKPTRYENFMNFLQFIVENSKENAIIDESAHLLMDGNIHTNLRFKNKRIYTLRLINKFFGKELEKVKIY